MALDRTDLKILAELQKNARISNKELSAKLGLAPSTCHQRMKNLMDQNVVRGFYADLDLASLGVKLQAFIAIQLAKHSKKLYQQLHSHLISLPEVLSVYLISGPNDLLVHVAVKDSDELRDLILDSFASRKEVQRFETSIIYIHSYEPSLPVS